MLRSRPVSDFGPGIALLFGDGELGNQLRLALQEHGARIVHEGHVGSLSRDLLTESGAEVVVVNLEDEDDDTLDRLYDVIDGDTPRAVFNAGQASSAPAGWDRARWARHLAAKVMASADVDPPRPRTAPTLAIPVADTSVTEGTELAVDNPATEQDHATTTAASSGAPEADAADDPASIGQQQDV